MKIRIRIFFLVMSTLFVFNSAHAQQEVRFVLPEVGASCNYQTTDALFRNNLGITTFSVREVSPDGRVVVRRSTEPRNFDIPDGTLIYNTVGKTQDVARTLLPYSPTRGVPVLTPGMKIPAVESTFPRSDGDGTTVTKMNGETSSWLSVTVPAGAYEGIRVSWTGYYTSKKVAGTLTGPTSFTFFYAPNLWFPVETEYKDYKASGGLYKHTVTKLVSCIK